MNESKKFDDVMSKLCQLPVKGMAFAIMNLSEHFAKAYAKRHDLALNWELRAEAMEKLLAYEDRQYIWKLFLTVSNSKQPLHLSEDEYYGYTSSTNIFVPVPNFPNDFNLKALVK